MSVPQAKVRTCLWFECEGEQAAEFYVTLLANSFVESTFKPEANSPALTIDFTLGGTPYQILNGGPQFKLTVAASISVLTPDQAETDQLWSALTANGGSECQCGWVTDKFGVSWQIVPQALPQLIRSGDQAAAKRTMDALMAMQKIDINRLFQEIDSIKVSENVTASALHLRTFPAAACGRPIAGPKCAIPRSLCENALIHEKIASSRKRIS